VNTVLAVHRAGETPFILGSGSNILIGDRGIRGVVIDNQAKHWRVDPWGTGARGSVRLPTGTSEDTAYVVWAESGVSFAALARNLAREGYTGVEWACGIPGTLGGAAVYNAGAYDGCLGDVLLAVTLIDQEAEVRLHVLADELKLGYRTSAILRREIPYTVVEALELAVTRGDAATAMARITALDRSRLDAQPRGRTGGSTFKNPEGHHAWELIDAVGLRGYRIGDAQISEKHANFFLNVGAARAADVHALMLEAQRRVKERFGIDLELEIRLVGEGFA
jgi:UDP-N-acetylmuramate dehydrogenase